METDLLSYLAAAYIAFTLGTMSPGPNVLAILETAFRNGRAPAIVLGLGMASGSLVWGISSVVGLTIALLSVPSLVGALQIAGAIYLFWLAYKSFRAIRRAPGDARDIDSSGQLSRYYGQGLIIQLTNPKSAVTWLVVYSLAIAETANATVGYYVILGNVILSVIIHVSYGLVFSLPSARAFYLRNRKRLQGLIGVLFCVLATVMLFARINLEGGFLP